MDIKYNGGGCGCGAGSSVLPQNGGDNNNNNNSSNNGGLMGMLKGFMGGQNMPSSSGGPGSDGANMPIANNGSSTMKRPRRKMKQQQMESQGNQPQMNSQGEAMPMKKSRKKKSRQQVNGQMESQGNQPQMNSQGEAMPMKKSRKKKGSRQMNQPQMESQGDQPQMNQPKKLEAKAIVFNNGSTLQGQVANMQQNLNSITGKKKGEMSGGQNNLATLHDKVNTIGIIVDDIKNSNNNSNSNLFGGNMYGGQNNLASLHDKVNAIGNVVEEIKETNSNNSSSSGFNLFGGKYPIANVFLKNTKAGGGVFDNIGNMFGMNPNSQTNGKVNNSTPIEPINTSVETPDVVARTPVKNSQLPDPTSVVNRSNMEESENDEQPSTGVTGVTGGTGSSLVNSLFGGYRATRRNRKYLKRYKKGKSIGFTMKASLKAKGLIKRANGSKRVSKKYRG